MLVRSYWVTFAILFLAASVFAQETHSHGVPERLGKVSFPVSCEPAVQDEFNRGVALLHSFAYQPAQEAFRHVSSVDPGCAMAHWGAAMTSFHQVWDPALTPTNIPAGRKEIGIALQVGSTSDRELRFIRALNLIFQDSPASYSVRAAAYETAMSELAGQFKQEVEAQVFYALALLANSSPSDKTHSRPKRAIEILQPLSRSYPDHPGITHYLIHACDSQELASSGLAAARAYAGIAPSAPHALHMPSHIFTRLGLWQDSISSNLAARQAANQQGDIGEELHAMDYLVYAYLQAGRDQEARQIVDQLATMANLDQGSFKIAYAATAMPVRYAVERARWDEAEKITPTPGAPPQVTAIAVWASGLALAHDEKPREARAKVERLQQFERELRDAKNDYWAAQVHILANEVASWSTLTEDPDQAIALMRSAADDEDALEKLPVTPGPVIPAREQLGYLLLRLGKSAEAGKEFDSALASSPGRRGALQGLARTSSALQQH